MRRARAIRIFLTATLVSIAIPAAAHDPDWKPDTEKGEARSATTPAREPVDESEPWPDPFAEERRWKAVVGVGGGYFVPWQGNGGHASTVHVLAASPGGHFRVGGEFLYRSYETRIFDVNDVDIDTYEVNVALHYLFNPGGISPYLGLSTGLLVNKIRKTEVQDRRPEIRVSEDVGVGWGVAAIAGLEIPLSDHFAFYGEVRAGVAGQDTDQDDHGDRETEDVGGATGILGIRYRF